MSESNLNDDEHDENTIILNPRRRTTDTNNTNNNEDTNIPPPTYNTATGDEEEYPDNNYDDDEDNTDTNYGEQDDEQSGASGTTLRHGTQSTPLHPSVSTPLQSNVRTATTPRTSQPPPVIPIPPEPQNTIGLDAAIWRTYPQGVPNDVITSELDWQAAGKGDSQATKTFRSEVLMQQGLVVFAFMQPEDTTLSLLHSAAPYMAPGADGALKGKDIGFVGDRLPFASPIPVLLQKERPWKWITVDADLNEVAVTAFYVNPINSNRFYTPPPTTPTTRIKLPRLILIPSNFVPFCVAKPRTPGQLLTEIVTELAANPGITATTYELLMNWCMAASQAQDGSSIITYTLEAAHSNAPTYQNWINRRLNATLGQQLIAPPAQPTPQPLTMNDTSALATLAAEFGKGVLDAINPPAGQGGTALGAIQGTTTTAGKTYDAYQYAVIQGFSNCPTQAGLQPIWGLFTQTKNVETVRLHIKATMRRWATRHCVNIHNGLLLPKTTIEAIRDVQFNPGGGVAYFSTAEKGISVLTCQPEPGDKRDLIRATEIAQEISTTNRTLAEALELGKNDPRPPPGTYQDLKATVGTFCGLLHTVFGPGCDYYVKCFELYRCLNSDNVEENAHHFDPLYCRQIIWAILDNGREYFNNPMLPDSFQVPLGTPINYPISDLDEFTRLIKNQTPIIKKNFPHQSRARV